MKKWSLSSLTSLLMSVSCVQQYAPPTALQPHAIVKFRRHYSETPGAVLSELLLVNGERAFQKSDSARAAIQAQTDAFLVHPSIAQIDLAATFSHQTTQTRQESYSCGTSDFRRTCYRTVSRSVTVVDGQCRKEVGGAEVRGQRWGLKFEPGGVYLIQLNYQDARNCSISCFKQVPLGSGKFRNESCPMGVLK